MKAREIMSTPVVTVRPERALKDVAALMAEHRVSGVPVVDRSGAVVGVISESDFIARMEFGPRHGLLDRLARWLGATRRVRARSAAELMTSRVVTAGPDAAVRELVHLMSAHDVNRIPIVAEGRILGIVTRADILRTFTRQDTAITGEIQWRLEHELWMDPRAVEVSTAAGVVTLAGEVGTRTDVALIERYAAAVDGVVSVDAHGLRFRFDDRDVTMPPIAARGA